MSVGASPVKSLRHVSGGHQLVLVAVLGHPQPVDPPDVLAPADHLADETLDRVDRRVSRAIGRLGCFDDFHGVQQAKVHRRRQYRVRHLPFTRQHGVFVRAKRGKPCRDELVEPLERLGSSHRPVAVRWGAPHIVTKPVDHRPVDVIECKRGNGRPRTPVFGRTFAIVVVEVPSAPGGLAGSVHHQLQPRTLPPVEILHLEGLPTVGPRCKVVVVTRELIVADDVDAEMFEQRPAIPTHGFHRSDPIDVELLDVRTQTVAKRGRSTVVDVEPFGLEFCSEVAHSRDHKVKSLPVPTFRRCLCRALHQ